MDGIFSVLWNNFLGFDWIILLLALGNALLYVFTRAEIGRIYDHFNARDYLVNLTEEVKSGLRAQTKREEKMLSVEELLLRREKMNKRYALYANITGMFPLLGMLGTVVSLIPMVHSIGTASTGLFFSALTSTFWGIVCALVFKLLDASISYKIEDNEKHMEYLLNPAKMKETGE